MTTARDALSSGVVNGQLYAIGGSAPVVGYVTTVEAFDPASDSWTTRAPMGTAIATHTSNAVGDSIYVMGGHHFSLNISLDTVEAYNPIGNAWTAKASMPTAKEGHTSAVVNDKIYAIGGRNSGGFLSTVEEFDPSTNMWTPKASMPTPRAELSSAAINGVIYVFGGHSGSVALDDVDSFDPLSNQWASRAAMPIARFRHTSTALNGRVYVFGGYNDSATEFLTIVHEYDPITDTWTNCGSAAPGNSCADMPTGRIYPASSELNGQIFVMGGSNNSDPPKLSANEVYTPPP